MALIDIRCTGDPPHVSEVSRPVADWPATPACPECGATTVQIHIPHQRSSAPPIIVFQAPDGSVRFPGDANGRMAQEYRRAGYAEVQIRGAVQMRSFESRMNRHERSLLARKVERRQEAREARESELRSELRRQMPQMTERGREIARVAMRRNDHKPREQTADANFYSEIYSYDKSNRDESRGPDGRRHRD